MQIELRIDGDNKIFTAPFIPMLAKRKYWEFMAKHEKKLKEDKDYIPSYEEQLKEEDEMVGILANIIFEGQFTIDDVYNGADSEYIYGKLQEAFFNKKPKKDDEGNKEGK
jgi:hypothetical protein